MANYSDDPTLYLYTSLTAGSSHIVTATSRLETILRANRIPFKGLDVATDERARMLWGRRAGKDESGRQRKLPGLVQMGLVLGDLVEVEDWNEYGELKQHVKIVQIDGFKVAPPPPPVKPPTSDSKPISTGLSSSSLAGVGNPKRAEEKPADPGAAPAAITLAMRKVGAEAAAKAKAAQKVVVGTAQSVGKKVEQAVHAVTGPDVSSDKNSTGSFVASTWLMYTDSIMQASDGTWSCISGLEGQDGPISSIIYSGEALQSPSSGTWKNNPLDSITSVVGA